MEDAFEEYVARVCEETRRRTIEQVRAEIRAEHEERFKQAAAILLRRGYSTELVAKVLTMKIGTVEQVRVSQTA